MRGGEEIFLKQSRNQLLLLANHNSTALCLTQSMYNTDRKIYLSSSSNMSGGRGGRDGENVRNACSSALRIVIGLCAAGCEVTYLSAGSGLVRREDARSAAAGRLASPPEQSKLEERPGHE